MRQAFSLQCRIRADEPRALPWADMKKAVGLAGMDQALGLYQ